MKIAISGKGGVGKTILASLLAKVFAESGYSILAIDADLANLPLLDSSQPIITQVRNIYQALFSSLQTPSKIN